MMHFIGGMGAFQSHPYRRPMLMGKYEDDFPLRKTGEKRFINGLDLNESHQTINLH